MSSVDPIKAVLGVDPGATGASAFLTLEGDILAILDNSRSDIAEVLRQQLDICQLESIAIEKQHAMPKQGVVGMFSLGVEYGWWQGVFDIRGLTYHEIQPKLWQSIIPRLPKDRMKRKRKVAKWAARRWPDAEGMLYGPKGGLKDGRSDALAIAEFARRLGV